MINRNAPLAPPSLHPARALACAALGLAFTAATLGCGSSASSTGTGGAGGGTTSSTTTTSSGAGGGSVSDVRGDRYCEVLIGKLSGATVHIEVYNTYLLNDCPAAGWASVDAAAIKAEEMADVVILNGPRYWMMDVFEKSALIDPTPHAFGTLDMRLAGTLDLAVADVKGGASAYVPREVERTTSWIYQANKPVFELVDPAGRIFDMQSYSVQTNATQTMDTLADLGGALTLPAGWKFQTRTLTADLTVTAVDGKATVVQDDFANTYQLSQQAP